MKKFFLPISTVIVFCFIFLFLQGCSRDDFNVAKVQVSNLQSIQNSSKEEVRFTASRNPNFARECLYFSLKSKINSSSMYLEPPQINESDYTLMLVDDLPINTDRSAIHCFIYTGKDGKKYLEIYNNDRPPRTIYYATID